MDPWPFTKAEWADVGDAALPVVNAGLAEDAVLRASHLIGLLDVLDGLRAKHGDHPVLLETEADFIKEDDERLTLYRRAVSVAEANDIQTLSIRLSLAQLLIDMGEPAAARSELLACEAELSVVGDASDRTEWAELHKQTYDEFPSIS